MRYTGLVRWTESICVRSLLALGGLALFIAFTTVTLSPSQRVFNESSSEVDQNGTHQSKHYHVNTSVSRVCTFPTASRQS
jgi:hypothetical protein